ncbi:hypothetical protein DY000_02000913 [Brassica cretica]|uniref:Uncharacterized protein n=1 Tax=Brassica cretica TaxID=69181 RepID=A0ABQ7BU60_BRACR|nr:hypothetical protein DY000_02000913 [Brassica cretica]
MERMGLRFSSFYLTYNQPPLHGKDNVGPKRIKKWLPPSCPYASKNGLSYELAGSSTSDINQHVSLDSNVIIA